MRDSRLFLAVASGGLFLMLFFNLPLADTNHLENGIAVCAVINSQVDQNFSYCNTAFKVYGSNCECKDINVVSKSGIIAPFQIPSDAELN